ncbi:hypothetical protein FHT40_001986 [Mycolicibacterium sp. BK556]|uniref:hypothetical protein n=1 Tax=unclassified Mycolicibacterium TaxID=2636767 RepID=UPI00160CCB5F|nr:MULTISPECIES: hypothetical protein [unclassified Mycolicibacterium]MBB3602353.1 hypothetical protein [Mycolicibacterium sp. BK556]MBB3632105.1 hypothetical protein [Mycolicibacterium sp. BK607]
MEHARRPLRTAAALATAGALAFTPVALAPPELHTPSLSPMHISVQPVQLADAWSDLFAATAANVTEIVKLFVGAENGVPLPNPTIFLAPIATQFALNQLIYLGQLFTGQAGQIPGEISTHLTNVGKVFGEVIPALPQLLSLWIKTPFVAVQQALLSISTATNPLIGLLEAPAVFLNFALNTTTGLLGGEGPIAFPIIVRNVLAKAIDPPLPAWLAHILQPAKVPSAAALTPKSAVSAKVSASSDTASSARSKPKPTANGARKHSATASSHGAGGVGHGNRH